MPHHYRNAAGEVINETQAFTPAVEDLQHAIGCILKVLVKENHINRYLALAIANNGATEHFGPLPGEGVNKQSLFS